MRVAPGGRGRGLAGVLNLLLHTGSWSLRAMTFLAKKTVHEAAAKDANSIRTAVVETPPGFISLTRCPSDRCRGVAIR